MTLCESHNWIDNQGRYYIMASVKEITSLLQVSVEDANGFLNELEEFDLIEIWGHVPSTELQVYPKDISILEESI